MIRVVIPCKFRKPKGCYLLYHITASLFLQPSFLSVHGCILSHSKGNISIQVKVISSIINQSFNHKEEVIQTLVYRWTTIVLKKCQKVNYLKQQRNK